MFAQILETYVCLVNNPFRRLVYWRIMPEAERLYGKWDNLSAKGIILQYTGKPGRVLFIL